MFAYGVPLAISTSCLAALTCRPTHQTDAVPERAALASRPVDVRTRNQLWFQPCGRFLGTLPLHARTARRNLPARIFSPDQTDRRHSVTLTYKEP